VSNSKSAHGESKDIIAKSDLAFHTADGMDMFYRLSPGNVPAKQEKGGFHIIIEDGRGEPAAWPASNVGTSVLFLAALILSDS